jgi:hypothetical protein
VQSLLGEDRPRIDWADTEIVLPESLRRDRFRMPIEDRELSIPSVSPTLALSQVLGELPFGLLLSS